MILQIPGRTGSHSPSLQLSRLHANFGAGFLSHTPISIGISRTVEVQLPIHLPLSGIPMKMTLFTRRGRLTDVRLSILHFEKNAEPGLLLV